MGVGGSVCVCVGACGVSVYEVGLQVCKPVYLLELAICKSIVCECYKHTEVCG